MTSAGELPSEGKDGNSSMLSNAMFWLPFSQEWKALCSVCSMPDLLQSAAVVSPPPMSVRQLPFSVFEMLRVVVTVSVDETMRMSLLAIRSMSWSLMSVMSASTVNRRTLYWEKNATDDSDLKTKQNKARQEQLPPLAANVCKYFVTSCNKQSTYHSVYCEKSVNLMHRLKYKTVH